jgi:serine/threonine protein kinase
MSPNVVTCPRCSAEMAEGAEYCMRCGATQRDGERRGRDRNPENLLPQELLAALRRDLSKDYQVNDLLGRGGMSFVFLAQERELNRQVAIKVLPLQLMSGGDFAERFEREGKISASLDHPNIVPIFRVGASSTFLWYTMKRIRGRSLEQIIHERGGLPLDQVLSVVQQVGSALHYAHGQGVVHRDVKPANVMIEDSGWALVCDFGIARAFGSVSLTQTGASIGTPRYMAPEQVEGQPVDGRSDQYSLGILTWEALAGKLPFDGESVGELIRKHLLEPAPRLETVRPDLPRQVSNAVYRAMSKKPAERFPDVAAFVRALGGVTDQGARVSADFANITMPIATPSSDAPTIRFTALRRRPVVLVALVAGVLLVGAGAWWALRPSSAANGATPAKGDSTSRRVVGTDSARRSETPPPPPPPPPAAPPPVAPAARFRLSISTQPTGILYLDGRQVRSTPVIGLDVPAGRRRVQVKRDGYASFDTVLTAQAGQDIKLTRRVLRPLGP